MKNNTKMQLTGKLMDQESNVPKWDRISGMDPAGPLFFKDSEVSAYGFYCTAKCTSAARLNYSDGKIVDVIHTDGIPTNWGHIQVRSLFITNNLPALPKISKKIGCVISEIVNNY